MIAFSMYKKIVVYIILLFSYSLYSMEDKAQEGQKKLRCSFAQILPAEIVEKVIISCIDTSKDIDEAVMSLKAFQYCDKGTRELVDACLNNPVFSTIISDKLVKKCKKSDFYSEHAAKIIGKLLCPAGNTVLDMSHECNFSDDGKIQWYPLMERFVYMYFLKESSRNVFFRDALEVQDIKTITYCIAHGVNVDDCVTKFPHGDEHTALSWAIDQENFDLIKVLLEHEADPDKKLTYSRKNGIGDHWIIDHRTPRELAQRKGNQKILKLIENVCKIAKE